MSIHEVLDHVEVGRALGHDLYHRSHLPMQDAWPLPVREGFAAAHARAAAGAFGRREVADRFGRKWLQLRLGAWRRGRIVGADVTPSLLRRIDVAMCPVTRLVLTHGECSDSDASVDRLNNDGAYAANNLAVMSARANRAKGAKCYDEVFALSRRDAATEGLEPLQWLRLASLMLGPCFAARPQDAPLIPLAAPIPSHSARPAAQQIQHVFTQAARAQSGKNALIRTFGPASRGERTESRLRRLAEAVHVGLKSVDERHDVWLQPRVMQAFVDWRHALDERSWALAGEISRRLAGSRVVPAGRLATWHLETRGRAA